MDNFESRGKKLLIQGNPYQNNYQTTKLFCKENKHCTMLLSYKSKQRWRNKKMSTKSKQNAWERL